MACTPLCGVERQHSNTATIAPATAQLYRPPASIQYRSTAFNLCMRPVRRTFESKNSTRCSGAREIELEFEILTALAHRPADSSQYSLSRAERPDVDVCQYYLTLDYLNAACTLLYAAILASGRVFIEPNRPGRFAPRSSAAQFASLRRYPLVVCQ